MDNFSRKVPLTDEQVEQYADRVLKNGTKVLTSLQLEPLFDLRGKGGLAVGPNSRLDENTVYSVLHDLPIAHVATGVLLNVLKTHGTTLKAEKLRITNLAKEKSPEFKANVEEREKQLSSPDAPWNHPLFTTIKEIVGVSGVYESMGEPFSPTGRNRCLLGHSSSSGQTVMCTDNQHWHCFSCEENGDAWDLFRHIKGADNADGTSTFYSIRPEFAALAGADYKSRWEAVLEETRKAYGEKKRAERMARNAEEEADRLAQLNWLNENHFVTRHGGSVRIAEIDTDADGNPQTNYYTEFDFLLRYRNRKIFKTVYNPKKKRDDVKSVELAEEWLHWEHRREHKKGTVFLPRPLTLEESVDFHNEWNGFRAEPKEGCWDLLRQHLLHVWCQDDEAHFHYLMSWFAHLVQRPWEKPSVALVIKGGKGSGKSIILNRVWGAILGSAYAEFEKREHVMGRFNSQFHGKLLVALEEAVWPGIKDAEGIIKHLISAPTYVLESKGKDCKTCKSYSRIVFLSNEKRVVPASFNERRYFAMKTNDENAQNSDYFKPLIDEIDNGGIEAFLYALLHYEGLDIMNATPPITDTLMEDIEEGMDPLEQWIFYLLDSERGIFGQETLRQLKHQYDTIDHAREEDKIWGGCWKTVRLMQIFQDWCEDASKNGAYIGYSGIRDVKSFSKEFSKIFINRIKRKNCSHFDLPNIFVARKIFEKYVNKKIQWTITEEEIYARFTKMNKDIQSGTLADFQKLGEDAALLTCSSSDLI